MNLIPTDDRVEMPKIFKHILTSTFGIIGLWYIMDGSPKDYSDSLVVFCLCIFSGLATFGLVSILSILKQGKGFSGVIKEFYNNLEIVFKDDRKNKRL
tara:strand:+ start:211 stop:504 length:294 start_codon:yes stop_codon:yes gene_type:complete